MYRVELRRSLRLTLFEKSNFCPKIQFWQNPNILRVFHPKFFWQFFSWNQLDTMVVVTGLCYKLLNKSVKKLYGLRNNSFEIFIFCPNIQVSFSEKIVDSSSTPSTPTFQDPKEFRSEGSGTLSTPHFKGMSKILWRFIWYTQYTNFSRP